MARKQKKKKRKSMEEELDQPNEPGPFDDLADPPRPVSNRLRLHLFSSPSMIVSAVVIGIVGFFLPGLLNAPGPLIGYEVRQWRSTEGTFDRLERRTIDVVEGKRAQKRKKTVFVYHYTYRLPDGRTLTGASQREDSLQPAPAKGKAIALEYDVASPEINRLKGSKDNLIVSPAVPLLFFLVIALLFFANGLWVGFSRLNLLRHGQPGWAFLQCVSISQGESKAVDVPLDEYKQHLQAKAETSRNAAHSPVWVAVYWIIAVHLAIFPGVAGLLLGVFWLAAYWPQPSILAAIGFVVGFAGTLLGPVRWQRRRWLARADGRIPLSRPRPSCGITYETEDGEVIERKATVRLANIDDEEPPHPMLYNTEKPKRVLLLTELNPQPIAVYGGWDAPIGRTVWLRLALVVAGLVISPLLGLWTAFR